MGGNLVTINDAAENQFLVNAFGSNELFWIGFTDAVQEGNWQWINGEPVTYTNWASGEPNNSGNEDYSSLNWGGIGRWNDYRNDYYSLRGIIEVLNGTSTISVSDTTINESQSQATVTVKLAGISQQTFTIDHNTNDGTAKAGQDYTTVSGKLTFNAGESQKTITIPINNDTDYEGNETFTLNLSNPIGGAVLGQSNATITIIDNDVPKPGTLAFSNAQFSVNEDGTPIVAVKINRTNGTDGQVSATINLKDGTAIAPNDYTKTPITVTFANGETEKNATILILDDLQFESNETLNLTLTNATGGATIGTQNKATLNIIDNEINQGINLNEGQTKLIGNTVLKAVETNKLPTEIIYTLTDLPDNGQLILNGQLNGNTLTFDGNNDYVTISNPVYLGSDYTIEGWFKKEQNQKDQTLISLTSASVAPKNYGLIEIESNETLRFLHRVPAGIDGGTNIFSSPINNNQWHHFAATKNQSQLKLYIEPIWYLRIQLIVVVEVEENRDEFW